MTTETTIAERAERIDHNEQIERMLDAYDRPLTSELDRYIPLSNSTAREHLRGLMPLRSDMRHTYDPDVVLQDRGPVVLLHRQPHMERGA